jgi:hypothetical protein
MFTRPVDANGDDMGGLAYQLAGQFGGAGDTINANANGTAQRVQRGSYIWDAVFSGTSLQLQVLASDGVTWRTLATLNASGTFAGTLQIGLGSQVRLANPNGTALTGVWSSLS